MKWKPATIDQVREIVESDLSNCDAEQHAAFRKYRVDPCYGKIVRYGHPSLVVIVARKEHEVIYWEDVEEGFNVSPVGGDGEIPEHWCNQDELGLALNTWIKGRTRTQKLGPAESIK